MVKRIILLPILLLFGITVSFSQTILIPNSALKSHETLDIKKIVISERKTEIYLEVENKITGGNFCADRNIFIIYPDGTRSLLNSSVGIPVCPDAYYFKTIGEKLSFVLTFSPIKKGTVSIDLIEECSDNCFSFYGIILDPGLNKQIDNAFEEAENDQPAKALVSFIKIAEEAGNRNKGAEGLLFLNIIKLAKETGNNVKAAEYYKKLESYGNTRSPFVYKTS